MKKIHLLILKSFIRPFLSTFIIVMFVLLMLFLFKYIDDLIGKGFAWYVILELMMYSSATNVAMALPLSVLLSTIMTYGSLGENYELVAIKAAGISLSRAMYPMIIIVSILSISAFIFSDYMLPVANLKYFSLLYDVRQQRSATLLPEGVFSNSFPGYTIRVEKKGADGQGLYGVMIYQKDQASENTSVLFAKEGRMYRTPGDKYLVLKLKDGVRYEESAGDVGYNSRQRLMRERFKDMEQKFDLSGFKLSRTDENEFKSAFQMMNIKQLREYKKTTQHAIDSAVQASYHIMTAYLRYFNIAKKPTVKTAAPGTVNKTLTISEQLAAVSNGSSEARSIQGLIKDNDARNHDNAQNIRKSLVEYQKKYTLSAVCLVLFLIGAPLGAIIRKGGLGLPVVVSVAFFLIYYIISTIGEKSVKDGNVSPILGMWISIIILTPIGLFLSYKAITDSAIFDADSYKKFFRRIFRRAEA
ncbi:LptF/LptG family permease [Mucilaginibacter sp. E4BP6]|jgi:lipopolysaccharide export system permease protein|uniref:LptF/LptG family permease n=1 Tax=Mucilaginibacter sp. E4BP6 TaxID=2723089 RepID=UPI0015C72099|nr:LptF/LptG family permease [Mucilaginibacter sp. E4BP6]NYE64575.1 lipopolysaccharide export system permease protein [Mucilaginibacter sp. E4BP6]